jgi:hypothetical protein
MAKSKTVHTGKKKIVGKRSVKRKATRKVVGKTRRVRTPARARKLASFAVKGTIQSLQAVDVVRLVDKHDSTMGLRLYVSGRTPLFNGVSQREPREVLTHRARELRAEKQADVNARLIQR